MALSHVGQMDIFEEAIWRENHSGSGVWRVVRKKNLPARKRSIGRLNGFWLKIERIGWRRLCIRRSCKTENGIYISKSLMELCLEQVGEA